MLNKIVVIKRDDVQVPFKKEKIKNSISKAMNSVGVNFDNTYATKIANEIYNYAEKMGKITTQEIGDLVEKKLMASSYKEVAQEYTRYRILRQHIKENEKTNNSILDLIEQDNDELMKENSNKNPTIASTQRDYMAGEVSKELSSRLLIPKDIIEAHNRGEIHFHDMDYFAQHIHNCELVNLEDMLQNGTVINKTMIDKPKSFMTACTVATQIIAQVASAQYGGQTISISHLAPFVRIERERQIKELTEEWKLCGHNHLYFKLHKRQFDRIVEKRLKNEIKRGVQTIQYQINTIQSTNGQAPFVSVFMYLSENKEYIEETAMIAEEILKQRIQGTKNEVGVYVTPAFPKLLYVLEENNTYKNRPYYYLTKLAAKCSAKRLVPDYISEKKMKEIKDGYCFPCMGCRSFLSVYHDNEGNPKFYGRFNQGVVTLNLVDVALSSGGDMDKFWEIMEQRLDLCYRALMCRHNRLKGTPSDTAPIQWQHGAIARLDKHQTIDKLLYGGYSTISLGYGGLYECVKYMIGESHTTEKGKIFAKQVMQSLVDHCEMWKEKTNIGFSVYGTPMESTTYKFAKCLRDKFGIIEGITDKDYITNSYHINVREKIDAFSKLKFESEFQELSTGGCISYIETPDMSRNLKAVMKVIQYIYENIMYAELNTKSDYCHCCGYDGEILCNDDREWYCPNCGNHDQDKMDVARRTCGYIGHEFWNSGRTQEIMDRVTHL